MKNNIVSFARGVWTEEDKMTILFALKRVEEIEGEDTERKVLEEERANLGLFSKVKRHFS